MQEFLASFAVKIDEAGVSRLQAVLAENWELAAELGAAFDSASGAIRSFSEELGILPGFSGFGGTAEGSAGPGRLPVGLDLEQAFNDYENFTALVKQPVSLKASAAGIVSAARSAMSSIRSLFSDPVAVRIKAETSGGSRTENAPAGMPAGGKDSEPAPANRESLYTEQAGTILYESPRAGDAGIGNISQYNRNVSAPVNIHVTAAGSSPEQIGRSLYDTAERYLLRTLRSAAG